MKRFLLDTNICLAFVRGHEICKTIVRELSLDEGDSTYIISIVTKAELLALEKKEVGVVKKFKF